MTSKEQEQYLEVEVGDDFDKEVSINIKQFLVVLISFTMFLLYVFYEPLREIIDYQIEVIMGDWQLFLGIILLIAVSIGWMVLDSFATLVIALQIKINQGLTSKTTNKIRLGIAMYFIAIILAFFFLPFTFSDYFFWIWSGLIFFFFIMGAWGVSALVKKIRKRRIKKGKISLKEEYEEALLPEPPKETFEINLFLVLGVTLGLVTLFVLYFFNGFGFQDIVNFIWEEIIQAHFIITIVFWLLMIFTIFWKPILLLALAINWLSSKIITKYYRRKINKARIMLVVFVAIMLLVKNLPVFQAYLGWTDKELEIYSTILGIVASLIAGYVMRKLMKPIT